MGLINLSHREKQAIGAINSSELHDLVNQAISSEHLGKLSSLLPADGRVRPRQSELLSFWKAMDHHMVMVASSMKPDALLLKPIVCDVRPYLQLAGGGCVRARPRGSKAAVFNEGFASHIDLRHNLTVTRNRSSIGDKVRV
ncbi:hypothetical protein EN962_25240 [Mesorhizobium sp. M7A.F.Ca.CA.001.09.2.1]|uniref:Uncharacterized protein n=2 Tax=Mesorhizobium TaxID=68287 RepID=A0AB38TMK5_9HYPH|nr:MULTISPECIES: hypothetical protein [Mesorhizobium]RUY52952.1 hypothetical protein EN981_10155 [Mesorhizobium sp. M7A.F.Ca.CA.001.13.2.1]MDF3216832.1 hypothetical protein [Mesorhizobium ciceri]RUY65896.1 hypothetical protein EN965_18210 [Mesorhizobium sp. M7A.F.Ca.CA.001.05.1.1]RUY67200.1 hypothetical protein EN980_17995 [Mesorhizobium sp. M7A.F.Ca.CA.001.13.1.1]RUY74925.1 hypothetical protein EN962_25240 [Mesorhizobium sp. M7A.F.Ca.CA.001.09.2.1]